MRATLIPRDAGRPRLPILLGLLATAHCNAVLGIEEASCVGRCGGADAGSSEISRAEGAPDGGLPSASAAGSSGADVSASVDAPASLEGVETGTSAPPLVPAAAPTEPVDMIASACVDQPAGEPLCVVNHRVICGEAGTPETITVCDDADDCLRGVGPDCAPCSSAEDGACAVPECAPNERRCEGAKLQQCNEAGTRFETVENCKKAKLCDERASRCMDEDEDENEGEAQDSASGRGRPRP